jgi:uncharacterized membrane protein
MTLTFDVTVMNEVLTIKEVLGCVLIMIANITIGISKQRPKEIKPIIT